MLYYCAYTWFPNTRYEDVADRIVVEHEKGANFPERLRGWYSLAGGGAGFLIVDFDDPRELTRFLQPYMDLMSFDVRAIYDFQYDQEIEHLRQVAREARAAF